MTDIGGVLGSVTATAAATHTVYTVPTGKWAKGKLMLRGQNAAGAATVEGVMNGVTIFKSAGLTASHYFFTSSAQMFVAQAGAPDGTTLANTVAPAPQEYYLDEGDTVLITIGVAAVTAMTAMFVGVECDKV